MSKGSTIARNSLSDLAARVAQGKDRTRYDAPEAEDLDADFWKSANVVSRPPKTSVNLRLDNDVLEWFKARGKGHLTRMNDVLRAYVEAHK